MASLISALSIPSIKISEVVFVLPRQRESNAVNNLVILRAQHEIFRYLNVICRDRNIGITQIEYLEFTNTVKQPLFLDSTLDQKKFSHKRNILLSTSDTYCIFGFMDYTSFPITKKKLKHKWQSSIEFNPKNSYYVLGQPRNMQKLNNIYEINLGRTLSILDSVSLIFKDDVFRNFHIDKNSNYLLAIPPQIRVVSHEFITSFFEYAKVISHRFGLKLLIKPHPHEDLVKLRKFNPNLKLIDRNAYHNMPVELLFPIYNIVKVIASPSASLPFVGSKDLEVLMPKNRKLFRRYFLDQLPFLAANKIPYRLI